MSYQRDQPSSSAQQIEVGEGAIASLPPSSDNDLRLYYISTDNVLHEIYLENADSVQDASRWKIGNLDDFPDNERAVSGETGLSTAWFQDQGVTGHRVYFEQNRSKTVHFAQVEGQQWTFGDIQVF